MSHSTVCTSRTVIPVLGAVVLIVCVLTLSAYPPHTIHRWSSIYSNVSQGHDHFNSSSSWKPLQLPKTCELTEADRLKSLYEWCEQNNISSSPISKQSIRENFKDVYVDDKYKVMYCHIPKTGCTNWKKYLILMSGRTKYTKLREIRGSDAHGKLFADNVRTLAEYSDAERSHILRTYFKFMFVRHPLTRLLSAYRNKFEKANNPTFEWFRRKILIYNNIDSHSENPLTFTHFLLYLTDPEGKNMHVNEHWQSYQELCHPCRIKYDYIGHVETMTEDVKAILTKIATPYEFPVQQSTSDEYVEGYYNSLSTHLVTRVIQRYHDDFAAFKYNC